MGETGLERPRPPCLEEAVGTSPWSSLHSVRVRAGGASLNFDARRSAYCFYLCPGHGDVGLCLPPRGPGEQVSPRTEVTVGGGGSQWQVIASMQRLFVVGRTSG